MSRARRPDRRGAISVTVLAGVVVVAAVGAAGLGRAAAVTQQVARVQAAADLVAGAAVVADRRGAERVAAANGVALVAVTATGGVTTVEVAGDGTTRRASARPAGGAVPRLSVSGQPPGG